jgi:hypothetical protein
MVPIVNHWRHRGKLVLLKAVATQIKTSTLPLRISIKIL